MNIKERAAIVLQQIDAVLALAEKATPGPWTTEQNLDLRLHTDVCCRDGQDMVADCGWLNGLTKMDSCVNATFIAASRTGWPTALRCLKTAIAGLLEVIRTQAGFSTQPHKDATASLTTLCNQWEASRK